jgi:hypothetical protein
MLHPELVWRQMQMTDKAKVYLDLFPVQACEMFRATAVSTGWRKHPFCKDIETSFA